jgi:hypothetical protein
VWRLAGEHAPRLFPQPDRQLTEPGQAIGLMVGLLGTILLALTPSARRAVAV